MDTRSRLIGLLDDGHMHSGEQLAERIGCSRTAVWKHIRRLQEMGVNVAVRRGQGYRLETRLERLDESRIRGALNSVTASALETLEILDITDSTSQRLLSAAPSPPGRLKACLAEFQTGGRGRRGRRWFSPYAGGLCFSVAWQFQNTPADLPALGLVSGMAVREVLAQIGVPGAQLKWPNDVILGNGKAAGILIDVVGETSGPLQTVIGVGVNLETTEDLKQAVVETGGIKPMGLRETAVHNLPSRSELAGRLIGQLHANLRRFEEHGFACFAPDWQPHDFLAGRRVVVTAGHNQWEGVASGISDSGALRLDTGTGYRELVSGEVTVRSQNGA